GQVGASLQVHLHAPFPGVEASPMAPLLHVEVGVDQAVDVAQHIEVERSGDAQCVVISGLQQLDVLDEVQPEQQPPAATTLRAQPLQKDQCLSRREIAQR